MLAHQDSRYNRDVLDPALLRDRFDDVRVTLQKRGANLDAELQSLASLEADRRRLLHRALS